VDKHIPAYCTTNFIEEITGKSPIDYLVPEDAIKGKSHFELLDLISNGLIIKTDCSEEKLIEKSTNPYIKHLIKNNRISCTPKDFEKIRLNDKAIFQNNRNATCLYLLSGVAPAMLTEYRKQTGDYFCSLSSNFSELFEDRLQTFNVGENVSMDFAKDFFETHNAIVIADPFIFTKQSKNAIMQLIEEILPSKLVKEYHITFVGSDDSRYSNLNRKEIIQKWIEELSSKINRKLKTKIDYCICNESDFHDRMIITNNAFIFSGIGLSMIKNDKSDKDTSWIGFKIFKRLYTNNNINVLVYKLMREKLKTIENWISRSEQKNVKNPLLETINLVSS